MGPLAKTVDGVRTVMRAARSLRADIGEPTIRRDDVAIYAPDAATHGEWPTFTSDVATRLMRAGVRFDIDRSLPPPSFVNNLFNAYLSSHMDELKTTNEIPVLDGATAVFLGLASRGKLDRRIHANTGAVLLLVQTGNLTIYRKPARFASQVGKLRHAMDAIWAKGRLVIAPTATISPPKHGRALLAWNWQAFTKLGNLTDATAVAIPFGKFATGLPRSLQILGPPGSEEAVLDLASRLEAVAPSLHYAA
jgi:Asp-tRNA(Asn)/Glu-tRNA(Gln) amidotransferase A subunit family amidase